MIVSHRSVLITSLEGFIDNVRRRQADLFESIEEIRRQGGDASSHQAEARDQAKFIRELQDLLEEQEAALRRAKK